MTAAVSASEHSGEETIGQFDHRHDIQPQHLQYAVDVRFLDFRHDGETRVVDEQFHRDAALGHVFGQGRRLAGVG